MMMRARIHVSFVALDLIKTVDASQCRGPKKSRQPLDHRRDEVVSKLTSVPAEINGALVQQSSLWRQTVAADEAKRRKSVGAPTPI
jgi:hypothetical protein